MCVLDRGCDSRRCTHLYPTHRHSFTRVGVDACMGYAVGTCVDPVWNGHDIAHIITNKQHPQQQHGVVSAVAGILHINHSLANQVNQVDTMGNNLNPQAGQQDVALQRVRSKTYFLSDFIRKYETPTKGLSIARHRLAWMDELDQITKAQLLAITQIISIQNKHEAYCGRINIRSYYSALHGLGQDIPDPLIVMYEHSRKRWAQLNMKEYEAVNVAEYWLFEGMNEREEGEWTVSGGGMRMRRMGSK